MPHRGEQACSLNNHGIVPRSGLYKGKARKANTRLGVDVPHAERGVARAGEQRLAVRTEGDAQDGLHGEEREDSQEIGQGSIQHIVIC